MIRTEFNELYYVGYLRIYSICVHQWKNLIKEEISNSNNRFLEELNNDGLIS